MKKLFLIKNRNDSITANFNYELDKPEYSVPLSWHFIEKEKQAVSRLFKVDTNIRFGNGQIIDGKESIQVFFFCEFSNIELESIKGIFRDKFPVILVKE